MNWRKETWVAYVALMISAAIALIAAIPSPAQDAAIYGHSNGFLLPNPAITPGAVRTSDKDLICTQKARDFRRTAADAKKFVCEEYADRDCPHGGLKELDHLCPLTDGGADDARNLWVQPAPEYKLKDKVEVWSHREICAGRLTVEYVQGQFSADWTVLYLRMMAEKKK